MYGTDVASKPSVNIEVSEVRVRPGEVLTVWLQANGPDEEYRCEQVELRVGLDHKPQVFIDQGLVCDFESWKPMASTREGEE